MAYQQEKPVSESEDVWTQVTLSLRSQLAESVWFSTFQDVTPLESDPDTLRLLAPSAYVRDRILTRYLPLVTEALHDANEGQRRVEIEVEATDPTDTEAYPEPSPGQDDRMLRMVQHFGDQADPGSVCGLCDICAPQSMMSPG